MPVIDYDPNRKAPGSDNANVPTGTYEVEFVGAVDLPPFENSQYQKLGQPPEPRLGWHFKILTGPLAGKVIEQGTGSNAWPGTKLVALLGMMFGGACPPGKTDTNALIGRRYWLTWGPNPDSKKGYNHIASLMVPPGGSGSPQGPSGPTPVWPSNHARNAEEARHGAAPPRMEPTPPPGAPPPRPQGQPQDQQPWMSANAPPPPPPDREFWIPFENGVRKCTETEIRALMREGKGPSKVCPVDGSGGWQEPAAFQLTDPF